MASQRRENEPISSQVAARLKTLSSELAIDRAELNKARTRADNQQLKEGQELLKRVIDAGEQLDRALQSKGG